MVWWKWSLAAPPTVFYPHVSCAGGELLLADNVWFKSSWPP